MREILNKMLLKKINMKAMKKNMKIIKIKQTIIKK